MKIYVSLPQIGSRKVFEQLDSIKSALSRKGHIILSPLEFVRSGNVDYYLSKDNILRVLRGCHCIFFGKGWNTDNYCRMENEIARDFRNSNNKFKIFYE